MTGSGAAVASTAPEPGVRQGASPPWPERLRKRAEFLNVAKGGRFHASAFSLQAIQRETVAREAAAREDAAPGDAGPPRFGFTVTKKAGGSVERNRMRRRLREAARRVAAVEAKPGFDYVIVARRQALAAGFDRLVNDLSRALRLIGDKPARANRRESPAGKR